jgi:hypothetical protein
MNLNQISVPSIDLSTSILFYKKIGLKLIVEAMPHYARFECPDGESTFSIHKVDKLAVGEGVYVYFECENLDAFTTSLFNNGIDFEEQPNDKPWLWREARLKDPYNNQLILFFAGKNRKNPPWKIS